MYSAITWCGAASNGGRTTGIGDFGFEMGMEIGIVGEPRFSQIAGQ